MDKVRHDNRDGYQVVTVAFEQGESWTHDPGGIDLGNGLRDTSGHIGFYLDGVFQSRYPGYPPYTATGATKGRQPITGRKDRHPAAEVTVTCLQPGRLFYILRRGLPETPLDYEVLDPGESVQVPVPGRAVWFDGEGALTLQDVPAGLLVAQRRGVVFWDRVVIEVVPGTS